MSLLNSERRTKITATSFGACLTPPGVVVIELREYIGLNNYLKAAKALLGHYQALGIIRHYKDSLLFLKFEWC